MFEEEYIEVVPSHIREMVRRKINNTKIMIGVFTFVIMVLLVPALNNMMSELAWVIIAITFLILMFNILELMSADKKLNSTGKRYRGEIIDKVVFVSPAAGGEDTDYVYKVYFEGFGLSLEKDSLQNLYPKTLFDRIDVYPNNCVEIEHYPYLSLMTVKVLDPGDKSVVMQVVSNEEPLDEREHTFFLEKDSKRFHKDLQVGLKRVCQKCIIHKEQVWRKIATLDESGRMEGVYRVHFEGGSMEVSLKTFSEKKAGQLLKIGELPISKYTWVEE